jgi:NAD(P)-dependent dehydrogenase (short-subunit alcohol dehydrogenase family)
MARVALVTGGSRGIGAAISRALKAEGFSVAASYAGNDEAAAKFKDVLRKGVDDETKAGHLDSALALRTELTTLEASGLPLFAEHDQSAVELSALVPGTWKIVYFPNHVKKVYLVKATGDVALADSDWKGRLQKTAGFLVLDVGDGKLERWTFAGARLFIEHFESKASYPDNPVQIGIGEKGSGR